MEDEMSTFSDLGRLRSDADEKKRALEEQRETLAGRRTAVADRLKERQEKFDQVRVRRRKKKRKKTFLPSLIFLLSLPHVAKNLPPSSPKFKIQKGRILLLLTSPPSPSDRRDQIRKVSSGQIRASSPSPSFLQSGLGRLRTTRGVGKMSLSLSLSFISPSLIFF